MQIVILFLFGLLLSGCGTSVRSLLEEDSRLWWDAEPVIASAEALEPGLEDGVYAAEAAKHEACQSVTDAVQRRLSDGDRSFATRLRSDLSELAALLVPFPSLKRCAEAQARYRREVASLCRRLEDRDKTLSCPD